MISNWFVCVTLLSTCVAVELQINEVQIQFAKAFAPRLKPIKVPHGFIRYVDGVLTLVCSDSQPLPEAFPTLEYSPVKYLSIQGCALTTNSLKEDLSKLNIDTDELEALEIVVFVEYIPPRPPTNPRFLPPGNYTEGLKIKHLLVRYPFTSDTINYLGRNPGFLEPLKNLTTLCFVKVNLPPIPEHIKLSALALDRSSFKTFNWEGCKDLEELTISGNGRTTMSIPNTWPEECNKLKKLVITNVGRVATEKILNVLNSKVNLQYLDLERNALDKLPTGIIWAGKDSLTHLQLHNNRLKENAMANFTKLNKLTDLDLGANLLDGTTFDKWSQNLGSVKNLVLDYNKLTSSFCYYVSVHSDKISESLYSLERLSLNKMADIGSDCFKTIHFSKLRVLEMSTPKEDKDLELQGITKTNASQLEVFLRERSMQQIVFSKADYDALRNKNYSAFWGSEDYGKTNLTLVGAKLNCDCKNYWLARAMHESLLFPFTLSLDFHCKTGQRETRFLKEPIESMDCIKSFTDPVGCVIRIVGTWGSERHKSKTQRIDCHNIQTDFRYPLLDEEYKIISLNASDNQITSLHQIKIPDSLEWIDFRKNSISRLDAEDTDKLFKRSDRRVWLSNNQFVCDCDNKHLIDVLHEHRDQITDFDGIICIDSDKPLSAITSYEVCQITLKITLGLLGAFLILFIIAAILVFRYRFPIKLFLYSRGWCLSCIREEDLDSDKPFDAFLSYAHGDEAYVIEHLLPKLEGGPDKFRILVHFRDWVVGDWIPAQIMKSVQLSKRTVIVLSRNFVGSLWGSLEFKYAIASAAQEGRQRLLVLILDDVLTLQLEPELTAYIAFNTYLACGDPWFWEKLRYAMPHKKPLPELEVPNEPEDPQVRVEHPQEQHEMEFVAEDNV